MQQKISGSANISFLDCFNSTRFTLAKIILILLAVIVAVILAFSFVLGAVRRVFLGGVQKKTASPQKNSPREILYEKNDVVVLKGEAKPKQQSEQ